MNHFNCLWYVFFINKIITEDNLDCIEILCVISDDFRTNVCY